MSPSCFDSFGSLTCTMTSTRRSRLRCIMSALPIQNSSAERKWNIRECSRKRPRMERTSMFSLRPGTPGLSAQIPRTTISTGIPALDARYNASMTCSSTNALAFKRIPASRPASLCAISLSIRSMIPRRTPVRRYEKVAVARLSGVSGQRVEEVGEVCTDLRCCGEQSDVLVHARGLRVVVARADVAVTTNGRALSSDDEARLAVSLETDETVDDVNAGLLEFACPLDVGLLVEAGLDLHQRDNLLARFGGVDQCIDDGGVAGSAVQGLLDREHLGGSAAACSMKR